MPSLSPRLPRLALSYRTKLTLAFSALTLLGVITLGGLFVYTGYQALKDHRIATSGRMTACLASNISRPMDRDALYSISETVAHFADGWDTDEQPRVVILDPRHQVYTTNAEPARDYLALPLARLGTDFAALKHLLPDLRTTTVQEQEGRFFVLAPIAYQGQRLGSLIVEFPLGPLRAYSARLLRLVLGYSAALVVLLWLLSWLLGKRMTNPLRRLTESMRQVGSGNLDVHCELDQTGDELSELARCFDEMLVGLREKDALEDEMVKSERLAAIGRVSAGMAHEINNPLGGMINAISTYHRHSDDPEVARKTLDLLDRGLAQLRTTVQALLVNARLEERSLNRQDLEDIRTLLDAQVRRKRQQLICESDMPDPSGLPASQVRQVVMNLILNAIQATPEGGRIEVRCLQQGDEMLIQVDDPGPGMSAEQRKHLFEPFAEGAGGHGLGLWVSYRIVDGLGGSIQSQDLAPGTRFEVRLPRNPHYLPTQAPART
jgi:signal transduction histidine kinase